MDTDPWEPHLPRPSTMRPLMGLTVLVVEDSRFACDAVRLLCLKSGARIRRADSIRAANRHLQAYRPSVVIVDIGLPDGDGCDLIRNLAQSFPRPEAIIATSGDPSIEKSAIQAGANDFLVKPMESIAIFQNTILKHLPHERQPLGPRVISDECVSPDIIAFYDDMAYVADVLDDRADTRALDYAAQFLTGVARSVYDSSLEQAAQALASKCARGSAAASETATLAGIVQNRLNQRTAV